MISDKLTYSIVPQNNEETSLIKEINEGTHTTIYLDSYDEVIREPEMTGENGEIIPGKEKINTWGYQVRVENPISLNKIIKEVEIDYYKISDYISWYSDLMRKSPESFEIKEHRDLVNKVTDAYYDFCGITLDQAKERVLRQITDFDSSDEVNCFYVNGEAMWADKATRVGLMNSVGIEKQSGKALSTLWFNDKSITVSCEVALAFLSQVELYAVECYNKTAEHKALIKSLTDIDEILGYNYKEGYPEKLSITI